MEAQVLERDTERLQEALDSLPFLEPVVKDTLKEVVLRLKEAEGENLLRVVLFGSMARGDFDEEDGTVHPGPARVLPPRGRHRRQCRQRYNDLNA